MLGLRSTISSLLRALLLSAALFVLYLHLFPKPSIPPPIAASVAASTSHRHLAFGIAASSSSWPLRSHYLRLWWRRGLTRGLVFLDSAAPSAASDAPLRISDDASRFPFAFKNGLRSAVRVARIAKELVAAVESGDLAGGEVRWIVLGDDDTVFFPENLARTLAKYDWRGWYYVGGRSEIVEQNMKNSFGMAFGGGGFAISYPLAKVLAKVLDSCLMRYGHLYGSDARVFACLAELGVGLTHELGFHQVDLRGDLFGMLTAHPLTPIVSLHHLDYVDPLFPGMNRSESLKHLFEAVNANSARVLQQTICYHRLKSYTVSVSWGYAVQVFEGNQLLPDLLSWQQTFNPWRRTRSIFSGSYMFNTREFPKDPCKRPAVFFMESVISDKNGIKSMYRRHVSGTCIPTKSSIKNLQQIRVYSQLDMETGQVLRRHCCDVLPSSSEIVLELDIRKCKDAELIAMHP